VAGLFLVVSLYVFAGISYFCLRRFPAETPATMEKFLEFWRPYFVKALPRNETAITAKVMRKRGRDGAITFSMLPWMTLLFIHRPFDVPLNVFGLLAGLGVLYFGGFSLARGWYGAHCLRELKRESY